jgi:hypothetical protein
MIGGRARLPRRIGRRGADEAGEEIDENRALVVDPAEDLALQPVGVGQMKLACGTRLCLIEVR